MNTSTKFFRNMCLTKTRFALSKTKPNNGAYTLVTPSCMIFLSLFLTCGFNKKVLWLLYRGIWGYIYFV